MNQLTTLSSAYTIPGHIPLSGEDIISIIEQYFHLKPGEIKMRTRIREIVRPRQIAIWIIANKNIQKSEYQKPMWSKITRDHFKQIDHATLIHSFKTVESDLHTNRAFRQLIADIQLLIRDKEETVKELTN